MQNQSNTEQFLKLPYDLLAATSFVTSTGEIVEITLQQKVIYCWMKQRCEFFTREKKEYFDNLDSVANELSINRKTVMDAIKLFIKHNVLFAEKRKAAGAREKWFFKRFNNLVLASVPKPAQKASVSSQVKRLHYTHTNVAPTTKQPVKPLEEAVKDEEDFDSMIEIASDNYHSYSAPLEEHVDDVDEPSFMKVKAPGKKSNFESWMFTSKNLNSFKKGNEWDECLINFMLDSGIAEPYRVLTGGDDNDFSFKGERYQFNARSGYIIPSELPF